MPRREATTVVGAGSAANQRRRISLIAAVASNRVIGVNNSLPWRLPADLKHFRALTMGHHILMGRKTWESLPGALPGRVSVVITRDVAYRPEGAVVVHSIADAIAACADDAEVFFVGGADLYRQALALADRMYLTEVQAEFDGDAHFPEFDREQWREVARVAHGAENGAPAYHFVTYERTGGAVT